MLLPAQLGLICLPIHFGLLDEYFFGKVAVAHVLLEQVEAGHPEIAVPLAAASEPVLFGAGLKQEHVGILHDDGLDVLDLDLPLDFLQGLIHIVGQCPIENEEVLLLPGTEHRVGLLQQVPLCLLGLLQHFIRAYLPSCFLTHRSLTIYILYPQPIIILPGLGTYSLILAIRMVCLCLCAILGQQMEYF